MFFNHRLHGPILARILLLHRSLMNQSSERIVWTPPHPVQTIGTCRKSSLLKQELEQSNRLGADYRIYQQNVDLDAFFGEEPRYEKVSDVCLLNDHFILVKMPPPDPSPPPSKSRILRCFKCNRGSRVSPIPEVSDEKSPPPQSSCLQPWSTRNQDEMEVFDCSTRLTTNNTPSRSPQPATVIVEQPHPTLQLEAIQSLASGQLPPTSRGPLHWFLWPFRRRLDTRSKSKSQSVAVHKTYFVRWSKPPDTLWHGFGVDTLEEKKSELRRCRSAVF
ncbi:uncharacterized protein LOC6542205 [Drosophila erecta]|uniref:Uncharacterized protein n=1 Tax=Drosophila erecta TaxID=7220 RepID=B3N3X6_DROER|nr:uncharacterized protein LOC6542205 [Drosophila erecta]XP_026834812.1 uncharacterized protein LOC6542205 [Drosophila erecta]XP_026834813.1 uncharacterized protein LOC6542205 [Drosophila erecta]EDV58828.1 uncharacterized protein Dere_GG23762 [Drosophila erecta]